MTYLQLHQTHERRLDIHEKNDGFVLQLRADVARGQRVGVRLVASNLYHFYTEGGESKTQSECHKSEDGGRKDQMER